MRIGSIIILDGTWRSPNGNLIDRHDFTNQSECFSWIIIPHTTYRWWVIIQLGVLEVGSVLIEVRYVYLPRGSQSPSGPLYCVRLYRNYQRHYQREDAHCCLATHAKYIPAMKDPGQNFDGTNLALILGIFTVV